MIKFLLKGIMRDKSRSLLPIIIILLGVALTILLSGYLRGAMGDMVDQNARFDTGHVKVMSKAYAAEQDQLPNDLALLGLDTLMQGLAARFPDMSWNSRIRFGGLIDAQDAAGNSKGQGPASGTAIDLLNDASGEVERMNIRSSLVSGTVPTEPGQALVGHALAEKLNVAIGDQVMYFGTTMNGSMTFKNFVVSGTIRFGAAAMDKGAIIIDLSDAQEMLDMEDGAGEVLGFFKSNAYDNGKALDATNSFNALYVDSSDEFAPLMKTLKQQNGLADMLDYADLMASLFVFIFIAAMSIVLWNTGLLGGLRRYKEYGIRLALGESKGRIYGTMILEALLIGILGSVAGTVLGLAGVYYLQVHGIDISSFLQNSTMMMPSVMRAKLTPDLYYLGFIPGVVAMVIGTMLSGIGIYKRETATLFKDLEV
jgi:putative ABC transport system permease protein